MINIHIFFSKMLLFTASLQILIFFSKLRYIESPLPRANSIILSEQLNPFIIADVNNNGFAIFWHECVSSMDYDIKGRSFDINGKPTGPNDVRINNVNISGDQTQPRATSLTDGIIIVVWNSQISGSYKIQARLIDFYLTSSNLEFEISSPNDNISRNYPSVYSLSGAKFIVFYNYYRKDIYASIYDSKGKNLKSFFKINIRSTSYDNLIPFCAEFSNNSFIVVYPTYITGTTTIGYYARVFDSNYNEIKAEFRINTYTANSSSGPLISIGKNDEVLIVFDNSTGDIVYKIYNKDFSQIIKDETILNVYTTGTQMNSRLTKIDDDKNLICWIGKIFENSINNFSCNLVDFQGQKLNQDFYLFIENNLSKNSMNLTSLKNQQFIFTFTMYNYSGGSGTDVYYEINSLYQRVND